MTDNTPSKAKVMSWLEGLTYDTWPDYYGVSEVSETAKAALRMLEELEEIAKESYETGFSDGYKEKEIEVCEDLDGDRW